MLHLQTVLTNRAAVHQVVKCHVTSRPSHCEARRPQLSVAAVQGCVKVHVVTCGVGSVSGQLEVEGDIHIEITPRLLSKEEICS